MKVSLSLYSLSYRLSPVWCECNLWSVGLLASVLLHLQSVFTVIQLIRLACIGGKWLQLCKRHLSSPDGGSTGASSTPIPYLPTSATHFWQIAVWLRDHDVPVLSQQNVRRLRRASPWQHRPAEVIMSLDSLWSQRVVFEAGQCVISLNVLSVESCVCARVQTSTLVAWFLAGTK